jgi:ABC-type branched-subunit amino acid transport system ATPase component
VKGDIAMVVDDIAAAHRAAERHAHEGKNVIEIRNLDFFYGSTQVLFGVDLDIPDGEIVALLGTNGAGKSTLLRVITGLDHPRRGQVRYRGEDVTYLEAEQILELGIAQMPGGHATFPGMTVDENLRVGTFSFRKDRARVDRDMEQVYEWFPVLRERRRQLASTLSGGEQQMLALGKAFLLRPKVLCIDELSLGLSPAVTGELLGIVRAIHGQGTTVVIVEQSFNIALSVATRAVFMEKGEVRYSGPAQALHKRPDLLRSVFLSRAASNGKRR